MIDSSILIQICNQDKVVLHFNSTADYTNLNSISQPIKTRSECESTYYPES